MFCCEEEWETYFGEIKKENISSDIIDIMRYLQNFDETIGESEALRCWFKIYWVNNEIIIKFVEEHITNETYYNTHEFETKRNSHIILKIKASAEEYADMLIDIIENKREYKMIYGSRMNRLHFEKTKYAKLSQTEMI